MYDEVISGLNIKPDGVYVDGTLGGAGHAGGVCERLSERGTFVGVDQDEEALETARERLSQYKANKHIIKSNYHDLPEVLDSLGIDKVDGILLDIGVSSYQFDNPERGFSYRFDAPLDMRMDLQGELKASDVVNTYSREELTRVIREYGEEKFASAIAKNIVKKREQSPIETTFELVDIIRESIPAKYRRTGGHPAKKTFQAIRIEVNHELDVLRESLDLLIDRLSPGGRICVITFHSLEDRIVKRIFKEAADPACTCPPGLPVCVCKREERRRGKLVTRKPILPQETEMIENPRSKSSKLRILEHI
jgi:16S rRNA (cytosine1402-N4)-methyltransferase